MQKSRKNRGVKVEITALICGICCVAPLWPLAAETGEVTVRTVETRDSEIDDERFASGMVTRIGLGDRSLHGGELGQALLRVPGVYVRQTSSPGHTSHLSIRGGNPRQLVVELDGLRLSSSAGPGFDFGQVMTEGLESADVYRGSAGSVYGGGAVTGAVRLIPKKADHRGWKFRGRSTAGSFGTAGLSGAASFGDDDAGIRWYATYRNSRGDFEFLDDQGTVHTRLNNDHSRFGTGLTAHRAGRSHRLRFTGAFEGGESGGAGPSEFQQSFRQARHGDHRALATLRWEKSQLVDAPSLLVDGHATAGVQHRGHRYVNADGFGSRDRFESESELRTISATAGTTALVGDDHLARLDLTGRVEDYRGTVDSGGVRSDLEARRSTASLALADEWLLAGERLSLIGALRTELSSGDRAAGLDIVEPLLPALGAIVRLHRHLELRGNLARTFRLADFDELYLDIEGVRGNPELDPERAWTMDLGLRLRAGEDIGQLHLAYFRNSIESMILFLPVSAYLFEAQNLYGATAHGVEMMAGAEIVGRWGIDVGYTYTRARLDGGYPAEPPQLPGQPRHRLAARSSLDLAGLGPWSDFFDLSLSSALHFRSSVNLDNFGNLTNGPATRVDLGAQIDLRERFKAGLHIHNLLDHRRAQDSLHRPLPGRAAYVSLEMNIE